mgnify:CR=1 FL=1
MVDINDFKVQKECTYKGELYSVRDNGSIMRHQKEGKKRRPQDGKWTFGTSTSKGYAMFCGEGVHRIVATAFHGEAPSDQHIVDHYDTNRQNNRPENLRWLTKLENILNNPYTRDKVIHICGSIEKFLENPNLLFGHEFLDANFTWMRAVTPEEAKNTLERMDNWLAMPYKEPSKLDFSMGEWIYIKMW